LWWDNPKTVALHTFKGRDRTPHPRYAALPTPTRPFDACVIQPGQVDKYQTVRFDRNSYSVPRRWAFRAVSAKGYVDRVEVVGDGATVAAHLRSYGSGQKILDPLHFLSALERKPAALDHAPVYRDWQLPGAFATLRTALDARFGSRAGTRHYIRVLQLLASHSVERLEAVIAGCLARGELDATIVVAAARRLSCDNPLSLTLAAVTVRPTDLAQFDRLLSRCSTEGDADARRDDPAVAQGQPEATEAADDAVRVGEVGP